MISISDLFSIICLAIGLTIQAFQIKNLTKRINDLELKALYMSKSVKFNLPERYTTSFTAPADHQHVFDNEQRCINCLRSKIELYR